jgi:hypothetical protein
MSLPVFADTQTVNVPMNEKGEEANPLFAGYKYARLPQSGVTEVLVCSGLCLLADVYMQSGLSSSNLTIRDSITADATVGSTVVQFAFQSNDSTSVQNPRIKVPIRFQNGITAKLSSVAGSEAATILYLPIGAANK